MQFIPTLAYNLISVCQLMANGFSIKFDGTFCSILDKKTWKQAMPMKKTMNNMFPLELSNVH